MRERTDEPRDGSSERSDLETERTQRRRANATIDEKAGSPTNRHDTTDHVTDTRLPPATEQSTTECHAIVESTDAGPDLCTIYSIAAEDSLVTAWISAREGSYCSLDDVR